MTRAGIFAELLGVIGGLFAILSTVAAAFLDPTFLAATRAIWFPILLAIGRFVLPVWGIDATPIIVGAVLLATAVSIWALYRRRRAST